MFEISPSQWPTPPETVQRWADFYYSSAEMTVREVGRHFGRTYNQVRRAFEQHKIPIKPQGRVIAQTPIVPARSSDSLAGWWCDCGARFDNGQAWRLHKYHDHGMTV